MRISGVSLCSWVAEAERRFLEQKMKRTRKQANVLRVVNLSIKMLELERKI